MTSTGCQGMASFSNFLYPPTIHGEMTVDKSHVANITKFVHEGKFDDLY